MTHSVLRPHPVLAFLSAMVILAAACSSPAAGGTPSAPVAALTPAPTVPAALPPAPIATNAAPFPEVTAAPAAPTFAPPTSASTPAAVTTAAPVATVATRSTASANAGPVCAPGALTPAMTEGPYYKVNPPQRSSLLTPGLSGTRLTISGHVLDANCKPLAGARVDFWQADGAGQYDNQGYTLRGYQLTDAQGRYSVVTVVPGLYPGRTRHIHVKVTPAGGATLTSQLFFPNEPENARDGIFAAGNIMRISQDAGGETATFDFVVKAG